MAFAHAERPYSDYDVVIVGAGPAGCAAAYALLQAGLRVIILDQTGFPRDKACAGCLTLGSLRRLPVSLAPVSRTLASELRFSFGGPGFAIRTDTPVALVMRREFDAYFLDRCLALGADFAVTRAIESVADGDREARITARGLGTLRARYLIGADGANSQVRAHLPGPGPATWAVAVEGRVPRSAAPGQRALEFDLAAEPDGYGWVFPKPDHLCVGLYTTDTARRMTKRRLLAYASDKLGTSAVEHVEGFPLGIGGAAYRPDARRVLLAGDAAGMTESLLGEGIQHALLSGQLAARAILHADASGVPAHRLYDRDLGVIRRALRRSAAIVRARRWLTRRGAGGWTGRAAKLVARALVREPHTVV